MNANQCENNITRLLSHCFLLFMRESSAMQSCTVYNQRGSGGGNGGPAINFTYKMEYSATYIMLDF